MSTNDTYYYTQIAKAIAYLDRHFKEQPPLDAVAQHLQMSPYHFQRLFKEWVGVTPKKYVQYLSVNYAKSQLVRQGDTLFEAALSTGLSGTSRLHDLFINIEGMTPGEYKNGGEKLVINYSFVTSFFGDIIVASTPKGICHLAFVDSEEEGIEQVKKNFPNARYTRKKDKTQQAILSIFERDWSQLDSIKLHLKATPFQLKVWEALLTIPQGKLATYGEIAQQIEHPKAARAVGTAIGSNPIAYLIPCHRVIQASGHTGGYRWHPIRKKVMIAWEATQEEIR